MMKYLFIGLSLNLLLSTSVPGQDRLTGQTHASRSEVIAQNGMACTAQPLASQVAIDILKSGGNAIDAAIAANAALGLMEPTGCGIGGDLFAIVWDAKTQKLYGLNASGQSPKSLTLEFFKENGYEKIPAYGPLPVSVPGCVGGWFALHEKFGSRPIDEILTPAIHYAEDGFPVTELISYYWKRSAAFFKDYPNFEETFTIDGKAPEKGDIFKNPYLADTYRKLADQGRDVFYKGEIARTIEAFLAEQGGFLTVEDMTAFEPEWVEPMSVNYKGYDVWELPPNGQGIAALQMLQILEPFDLASLGFGSPEYIHLLTEAKKLAFEDRAAYYADPDFNEIDYNQLLTDKYAEKRRQLIDLSKAGKTYDEGLLETGNTTYLCVADKYGNMISLIQSNYRGMGSGMVPPNLGFMLQDRGELFSLEEDHPNIYEPGKRPFHTIIPGFVTKDGNPFMAFGVMGGAMQPQGHTQVLVNMIDFGMNLQEAGDASRIRHSGSSQPTGEQMVDGGTLFLESGFSPACERALISKGHKISRTRGGYGGYQAIMWDPEKKIYYGASESRKDGAAIGY
jgi:gamma-glutamyltranspeptidase/glutathione hydrolase